MEEFVSSLIAASVSRLNIEYSPRSSTCILSILNFFFEYFPHPAVRYDHFSNAAVVSRRGTAESGMSGTCGAPLGPLVSGVSEIRSPFTGTGFTQGNEKSFQMSGYRWENYQREKLDTIHGMICREVSVLRNSHVPRADAFAAREGCERCFRCVLTVQSPELKMSSC